MKPLKFRLRAFCWKLTICFVLLAIVFMSDIATATVSAQSAADDAAVQLRLKMRDQTRMPLGSMLYEACRQLSGIVAEGDSDGKPLRCQEGTFRLRSIEVQGYNQNGRKTTLTWACSQEMGECPSEVLLHNPKYPNTAYWWSAQYGQVSVKFSGEVCGVGLLGCVWSERPYSRTCTFDIGTAPEFLGIPLDDTFTLEFSIKNEQFRAPCEEPTYSYKFISDVTVPDGQQVLRGASVLKTWRLKNTGNTTWDSDYRLVWVGGDQWGGSSLAVPRTSPQQTADLSVRFSIADNAALGKHESIWWLQAPDGKFIGGPVYMIVEVMGPTGVTPTPIPPVVSTSIATPFVPLATVSYWADATETNGECTTIRWIAENVKEVYFEGEGVFGKDSRDVCPSATKSYTLRIIHLNGDSEDRTLTITVAAVVQPQQTSEPGQILQPSVNFWAERSSIAQGECVYIYWDVVNVREVYLDGEGVAGVGERSVCPEKSRSYVLRVVLQDATSKEYTLSVDVYAPVVNNPPAAPSLLGPDDWAVFRGSQPTLCAGHNSDPDNDGINEFRFTIYESAQNWDSGWITDDCVTPPSLGYYEFKWQAMVRDNRGAESGWSEARRYNVYEEYRQSENAPSLKEPNDWAEMRGTMPRLCISHSGNINGRPAIHFYFAIFESAFNWENGWVTDTCVTPPNQGPATFQWHAKARSDSGDETGWSPTWHFTVREEFVTSSNSPKLSSPHDWAELTAQTPQLCAKYEGTFSGKPVTHLRFVIYESAQGWDSEWQPYSGGELCLQPPPLDVFTFKWHVRGRTDDDQETDWSEDWHFTIRP